MRWTVLGKTGVLAMAMSMTTAGWAQPAPRAEEGEITSSEALAQDIVVTGTKKAGGESVQKAPLAVTAYGAAQLEAKFFRDLTDIGVQVPNVQLIPVGTIPGYAGFSIRGLGINGSIASIDPAVGVFLDGVYMGIPSGIVLDNFDLDGVEVLRGPQGLLFGRNVTGGAVVLRTSAPTFHWTGNFRASVETGLNKTISGVISGPIAGDIVAAKLAAYYNKDNGWFRNRFDDSSFGKLRQIIIRPAIRIEPSDGVTIDLRYEHGDVEGDGTPQQSHALFSRKTFNISQDYRGFTDQKWDQAAIEFNVDVGPGTLTNLTAYRKFFLDTALDVDGTPRHFFHQYTWNRQKQFSNETRYSAKLGDFDLTSGIYYFYQDLKAGDYRTVNGGAAIQNGGGQQKSNTYAFFTSVDWHFADTLALNLGGRYTREHKSVVIARLTAAGCNLTTLVCNPEFVDSKSWKAFTPKIGMQWKPDGDTQVYGFYTRGFRSGGYNTRNNSATVPPGPTDQEIMDSFEIGAKHSFGGGSRVNVAIFRNKLTDLQREVQFATATTPVQVIRNTADATIQGFEVEGQVFLARNIVLSGQVGYTDGKYDKVIFDISGDGFINAADKALKLPRLIPWSYGVGLSIDQSLGSLGTLTARGNFNHRDLAFHTENNRGILPGADMVDASLTLATDWGVKFSIYGKNLLNEVTFGNDAVLPVAFGGPGASASTLLKGRVIGAEVRYSF